MARKLQFKTGDFCLALVRESSTQGYIKARIDDIIDDKYFVYVPELKESFYLFMEHLKPLLTIPAKIEQISYDDLPGYYKKNEDAQKEFQYPKKKQKAANSRPNREEDNRQRRPDTRHEQRSEKGEGRFENRNEAAAGPGHQRRDRKDRKGGPAGDKGKQDRRARPNEKSGKKQESERIVSATEEPKRVEGKNVPDNTKPVKNEKTADAVEEEEVESPESAAAMSALEKEKTAKEDESPAAFWGRMRKDVNLPEKNAPAQKSSSKPSSPTGGKSGNAVRGDEKSVIKEVKKEAASKKLTDQDTKDTKTEKKATRVAETHGEKLASSRPHGIGRGSMNKPLASKQAGRSRTNRDIGADVQAKKTPIDTRENPNSSPTEGILPGNDCGLQFMADPESAVEKESEIFQKSISSVETDTSHQQMKEESKPVKIDSTFVPAVNLSAVKMEEFAAEEEEKPAVERPSVNHEMPDEKSPIGVPSALYKAEEESKMKHQTVNQESASNAGGIDSHYNSQNREVNERVFASEGSDAFSPLPVDATEAYQEADTALPANLENDSPLFKAGEQKNEQRIRILTKSNKGQFDYYVPANNDASHISRDKSPDPESKKAMSKKVSFGEVIEFSETDTAAHTEYDPQPELMQNQYLNSNDIADSEEHMYVNSNYNQSMAMPMPVMMPMMHGNEQIQMPPRYSMDPEGRDLPQREFVSLFVSFLFLSVIFLKYVPRKKITI